MARLTPPAIVILGAGALETARRIQMLYAGCQVHATNDSAVNCIENALTL